LIDGMMVAGARAVDEVYRPATMLSLDFPCRIAAAIGCHARGMRKFLCLFAAIAALGAVGAVTFPRAERVLSLWLAADDAVALADQRIAERFDAVVAAREIESALSIEDIELAESFVALAEERGVPVLADLRAQVTDARSAKAEAMRAAARFGRGFITGDPDDIAGLAGAAAGDLSGYGDFRDLWRESVKLVRGEEADTLMMALAGMGIAVTAGTYFSFGAAAPARAGLSVIKTAQRTRRISESLVAAFGRVLRAGRTGEATAAVADLGRIRSNAGARTAFEGLRHADNLADISRLRRLAEVKGRSTLAILKMLGRGALVLGAVALTTVGWVFGAAVNLYLLIAAIVSTFVALIRCLWPRWRNGVTAIQPMTLVAARG
jgi:hypothetical protein